MPPDLVRKERGRRILAMACFGILKALLRPVLALGLLVASSLAALVEGDWGLGRPNHAGPTIIRRWDDGAGRGGAARYFPSAGHAPGYGRLEIEPSPNRIRPARAESFHQVWSAGSGQGPVTEYPPFDPPPVILAPREASPDRNGPDRDGPRRDGPPRR
jgi:hypothetical protein